MTDRKLLEDVRDAMRWALKEMCHANAPRDSYTDAVDSLDDTLSRVEAALAETEEVKVEKIRAYLLSQIYLQEDHASEMAAAIAAMGA